MGVFGQQHQAKGIPIQSGDRVKGAELTGCLVVGQHPVGQGAGVAMAGRVNEHPGGLIHHQQLLVFIDHAQRQMLRLIMV